MVRLPLPRNRLVQLTLVGAVLTTAVAAGLLAPGLFGAEQKPDDQSTTELGPDAPTPNDNYTPQVAGDGEDEEHEEYGEYEDDDEEDEEHDEYDDHDEDDDEYEDLYAVQRTNSPVGDDGGQS